ncbi:hypothetical protein FALCPG4_012685 [Fusarium falciforme]
MPGPKGSPLPCNWDSRIDGRSSAARVRAAANSQPPRIPLPGDVFDASSHENAPASTGSPVSVAPQPPTPSDSALKGIGGPRVSGQFGPRENQRGSSASFGKWQGPTSYGNIGQIIDQALGRNTQQGTLGIASVAPLADNIRNASAGDSAPDQRSVVPFAASALDRHKDLIFQPSLHPSLSEADFELPRRAQADRLFSIYWDVFHPIFPTLDPLEVQEAYTRLWISQGPSPQNRIFLSIVNAVFALASRVDTGIGSEAREEASARYCGRALALLNYQRAPCVSFQSIQAALLISEYLHPIDPQQCWMHVGMAIRAAQSLGLQRARLSARVQNDRAKLLLRRVWYLCVAWDRILCMTYGRPMMVSREQSESVPLLDFIPPPGSCTTGTGSDEGLITSFLARSVDLYSVVARALEDFSIWDLGTPETDPSTNGHLDSVALDRVLMHEKSLSTLVRSLPEHLTMPSITESSKFSLSNRHAVIFHQRSLQSRIILLRPVLSHLVRVKQQSGMDQPLIDHPNLSHQIAVECAISCASAACEAIDTISTHVIGYSSTNTHGCDLTNTWWSNVLYLYSAGTALIAACICDEVVDRFGKSTIIASWNLALNLFRHYGAISAWAGQLSCILQALAHKAQTGLHLDTYGSGVDELNMDLTMCNDGTANSFSQIDFSRFAMLQPDYQLLNNIDLDTILDFGDDPFNLFGDGMFGG